MLLVCISLIKSDVELVFAGLVAVCISSLKKCPFKSFAIFFGGGIICSFIELQDFFIYFDY